MTLHEKLGQMVQLGRDQVRHPDEIRRLNLGSVLSGGGSGPNQNTPENWSKMVHEFHAASLKTRLAVPILYGVDAVHGHNNVHGAVIFPHNIGLGATRDPDLVERIGRVTAEEVLATGVDWTFAPVVAAARDERWGRTYEAFGETSELAEQLAPAAIRGLQGARLGKEPSSVLACAKHFLGDGATELGDDQGDAKLDDGEVRSLLLPAYARAVEAGVGSIMVSYSSIRGVKMHCNGRLITDVLKRELGFNGFVVSDWQAIDKIPAPQSEQLTAAINGGIDMIMHPTAGTRIVSALAHLVPEQIPVARVDDAVRRILAVKCEMGLLESGRFPRDQSGNIQLDHQRLSRVGALQHRRLAREAVQKSLVLLKNEQNVLPLKKDVSELWISGKSADDVGNQCGGWTIKWEGASGPITPGTSILAAIKQSISPNTRVVHRPKAKPTSVKPDAAIVVIGETPYVEFQGDREDLALDKADVEAVRDAKASGAPIVVILITGRPLILGAVLELADALLVAWLPGTEALGITDVLFGAAPPTGKLPHSWPKTMAQIPINIGGPNYEPLFPFGFGLSYAAAVRQ
jgi:beta-glucosidase